MQARAIAHREVTGGDVPERDVVATLDAVQRWHAVRVEAEVELLCAAAHFADLNAAESLAGGRLARPAAGGERAVRLGGVGTPLVREFAAAELGARMQLGSWAAKRFIADALDARHRLPRSWARLIEHRARVGHVRLVASRTRHLSPGVAATVDAAMADCADGSVPWGRFEARLDGVIVRADPDTAAQRERDRVQVQFAKRTRVSEQGTAGFYVRSTAGVIARLDATIEYVADALLAFADPGSSTDRDTRRVQALVVLCNPARAVELLAAFTALRARSVDVELPLDDADHDTTDEVEPQHPDPLTRMDAFARRVGFTPARLPAWLEPVDATGIRGGTETEAGPPVFSFDWSRLLPPLTLNLHLSADSLARGAGGVVRWEGVGPVTEAFVHEHLRPLHRYRIQPVIDLAQMAPVDAYEIPDRHRRAVHLRTPADAFPYSSNVSESVDVDHVIAYQHATASPSDEEQEGQTRVGNLLPLGRFHHRTKTHGSWTVRQPFDGIVLWRDPHGQIFLVDHTGTRQVTRRESLAGPARRTDPDISLWHPHTSLELAPAVEWSDTS